MVLNITTYSCYKGLLKHSQKIGLKVKNSDEKKKNKIIIRLIMYTPTHPCFFFFFFFSYIL